MKLDIREFITINDIFDGIVPCTVSTQNGPFIFYRKSIIITLETPDGFYNINKIRFFVHETDQIVSIYLDISYDTIIPRHEYELIRLIKDLIMYVEILHKYINTQYVEIIFNMRHIQIFDLWKYE